MKKLFCLLLSAVMVVSLAACGNSGNGQQSQSGAGGSAGGGGASPADYGLTTELTSTEKITIRLAYDCSDVHPSHRAFVEKFQEPLEAISNGNITVELYPNSQLGSLAENLESMRIGDLEMSGLTDSTLAATIPEFNLVGLPFLWTSIDAAHSALDGDFGDYLNTLLNERVGIINFGYLDVGFRNITNSKRSISLPADLQGLKIRTMTNALHVEYFTALGAIPTPMAFGELFTALQQKTVDGQENPTAMIYNNAIYEAQSYMTVSEHVWTSTPFCIAADFYYGLPEDYQALIAEAAVQTVAYQRELITEQNSSLLSEIEAAGVEVTVLTAEEKAAFQKVAEDSVYITAAGAYGQELIDMAAAHNK